MAWFAQLLREHRVAAHHTQESLALVVEVDRTTIVRLEGARSVPSFGLIERLASELGPTFGCGVGAYLAGCGRNQDAA